MYDWGLLLRFWLSESGWDNFTLETSGEDAKTTLETSVEDAKTTLETSGEEFKDVQVGDTCQGGYVPQLVQVPCPENSQ